MTDIQHFTVGADAALVNEALDRDGCVIFDNLLPDSLISTVRETLAAELDETEFGDGVFVGGQTKRIGSIVARAGHSLQMLAEPHVLSAMDHMLSPYCERFQLNLTQLVAIYPGERAQILHRDENMFPVLELGINAEVMVNAMWALTDFTADSGGTRLVPGSHKWSRDRVPTPDEVVSAEMKAGSVLVYRGSLIHSGGENVSDAPRLGLLFGYNLGWLRQYENQYLACPPELAQYLPFGVQRLLGYTVHRPNLGLWECDDPQLVLNNRLKGRKRSADFLTEEQAALLKAAVEGAMDVVG